MRKEKQLHGSTTWCDFLRDKIAELTAEGLRTRHSSWLGEDFVWTLFWSFWPRSLAQRDRLGRSDLGEASISARGQGRSSTSTDESRLPWVIVFSVHNIFLYIS